METQNYKYYQPLEEEYRTVPPPESGGCFGMLWVIIVIALLCILILVI